MVAKLKRRELESPPLFAEKFRPQLHFSSPRNWLNDPNGLVWNDGVFHLFYQYNPTGNDWGNMHWGHATSKNLVDWDQRPIALHAEPLGLGYMFSGCAVIDHKNSSGLGEAGESPMVAVYTSCDVAGIQAQSVAYSVDNGETWTQYEGNPVISNPGIRDFRDPKVLWHEATQKWVLTLAADDHVEVYRSQNLIHWEHVLRFAKPFGSHQGVWECPDLYPMQSPDGETKWVLVVSVSTEHSKRDESIQYFIGDFDGEDFTPQHNEEMWLDHGADNYGAVSWDNVPAQDGRRIMIGWMSSWRYAKDMPTYPWRGNMSIPREIRMVHGEHGYALASLPVREVEELRIDSLAIELAPADSKAVRSLFAELPPELLDFDLSFRWPDGETRSFGLRFTNANGEKVAIAVYTDARTLIVDRTTVGQKIPNPKFAQRFEAPLRELQGNLNLRVIKDRASVEVFGDDGRAVISANLFYDEPFEAATTFGDNDVLVEGNVSILRSIWQDK